jgi:hypothetical protein
MPRSSGSIQDRTELILALYEARRMAEKNLSDAPEYLRGLTEGLNLAIEIVRAIDSLSRTTDFRKVERRA